MVIRLRAYELSSALSLCILHASDTCPLWRCSEMIKMNINTAVNIVIITAHDTCWANRDKSFLLRVSTLTRDIDIAIMSVCLSVHLSVCPSLSGVLSKRLYCAPVWSRSAHTSRVDVQLNSTMRLISGTLLLHLSHGFQCSPTLNRQPYEGRLPLTSSWRKSSNVTVGQSSLISLIHHCYD